MMKVFWCGFIFFFCELSTVNCQLSIANNQPKYEFRAVWIASVNNIDWPSNKHLTPMQQQQEFISILNYQQKIGINAVIVQIRPSADAFYASKYEPWSEFLTGKQGLASSPYYDPLKFMIDETHKRGMEFHAWINPYRAVFSPASSIDANHITKKHPEWFLKYGDRKYFNPGLPQVMQYLTNVVKDIITRYDVDAIHMDDYFYPYRIAGKEFPDYQAYLQYGRGLSIDAWRRSNCDTIVKMIHDVILDYKPLIKFGISPFGVWRNSSVDARGSNTKAGQTCYDDLYADILLWLKKGWIDYVAPQLYWEIGHKLCDYETLLDWWAKNSYGKQVYIGHGLYRAVERPTAAWRNTNELPDEINLLREYNNVQGSVFYSCKNLMHNVNGWADSLRFDYYRTPALIPPMNWVDTTAPMPPHLTKIIMDESNSAQLLTITGDGINKDETETIKQFVVYVSQSLIGLTDHPAIVIPVDSTQKFKFFLPEDFLNKDWSNCYVGITSIDRENNESAASNIILLQQSDNGWEVKK